MTGKESSTTVEVVDSLVNHSTLGHVRDLDTGLLSTASSGYVQGIKEFLAKPYRIRTGVWTDSSPFQLHAIAMPEELLSLPLYKNKVDGFLGFRGTLVMRLQVNANKFQQGRLIMSFFPQAQVENMRPNARLGGLIHITQLPNVQLDAACESEAVLRIPYVSPTSHYNLIDKSGPMGAIYLHVYHGLRYGTGSNEVTYTLWASFEDVELVTPTVPYSFYSQAGGVKSKSVRRDVTDAELASSGIGPISSVFRGVASVSRALSSVPSLSAIAAPVTWVSDALAKTASHFGWSNPMDESPTARVKATTYPMLTNSDTADLSLPLSLKTTNKVECLPGFAGTDVDEMSLSYITSIPAYIDYGTWTTGQSVGHLLMRRKLSPWLFRQDFDFTATDSSVGKTGTFNCSNYTPAAFVSSLFKYYRGSVKLTLKFSKTEYHSGRILVAYVPGYTGDAVPSLEDTNYVHRHILDIRDNHEFTVTFPFASTTTWKERAEPYGTFYAIVLNKLTCPDTVSATIDWAMEMCMDTDAEFAVPEPYDGGQICTADTLGPFVSQMGGMDEPGGCEVDCDIGNASIVGHNMAASKFCIGEVVTSFRELAKRSANLRLDGKGVQSGPYVSFRPFSFGGAGRNSSNELVISSMRGDWLSILAPLYAYNRGGVRYVLVPSDAYTGKNMQAYSWTDQYYEAFGADFVSFPAYSIRNGASALFYAPRDAGVMIQVPHYNQLHSRLNRLTFSDTTGGNLKEPNDLYSTKVRVGITTEDTGFSTKFSLRRQASDDFAFGFFIGVPSMFHKLTVTNT